MPIRPNLILILTDRFQGAENGLTPFSRRVFAFGY